MRKIVWTGKNFVEVFGFTEGRAFLIHGDLVLDMCSHCEKVDFGDTIIHLGEEETSDFIIEKKNNDYD